MSTNANFKCSQHVLKLVADDLCFYRKSFTNSTHFLPFNMYDKDVLLPEVHKVNEIHENIKQFRIRDSGRKQLGNLANSMISTI